MSEKAKDLAMNAFSETFATTLRCFAGFAFGAILGQFVAVALCGAIQMAVVKDSLITKLFDHFVEVNEMAMCRPTKTLESQHDHETDFVMIDHIADANKMVQPSPSDQPEKAMREIIIFTRPNCPPCDQWKRCEQAKFEADGWIVAYCSDHNFGLTPHFSIEKNGKTFDHKGYLPFAKIDEVTR